MKSKKLERGILNISILIVTVTLVLLFATIVSIRYLIRDDLISHNSALLDITYDQIVVNVEQPFDQIEAVEQLIRKYTPKHSIVEDYLTSFVDTHQQIKQVLVVDSDGQVINMAKTDVNLIGSNVSYEDYFINKRIGKWSFSNVYFSNHTQSNVIAASIDEEEFSIVIEMEMALLPLSLLHKHYFNEEISISILDEYGTYILAEDSKKVEGRYQFSEFDLIKDADNTEIIDGNTHILFKKNNTMKWYLLIETTMESAYQTLNSLTLIVIVIWLIFVVILFIIVLRHFKKVRLGINVLQSHTKKILMDQYDFDLEPVYFDEFEVLDNKFRHMAKTIDLRSREITEINEQLEIKVKERTLLLETSNQSLEKEIQEREQISDEIRSMNSTLDKKVKERTTQYEKLNDELKESMKNAELASESKSRFLAIMSHEMRTPLNGIIGFANMLKADSEDVYSENIDMILSSSQVLLSLINDVLDIAKYESGEMHFESVNFNLYQVLKGVIEPIGALIKSKGLKFNVEGLNALDLLVIGDPVKLQQLMNNLLNNALKFTDQGAISLDFILEIDERLKLTVIIKDTGIGMSEKVLANVFYPFRQADDSIHRRYGGSGLGLAICKEIVERLDGEIFYESVEDVGTTCEFYFYLDTKSTDTIFIEEKKVSKAKKVNRVLVAEDHVVNQTLIKKFLSKYEVNFDLAENGKIAVDLVKNNTYDLILMDCQMPVMDGFEATKRIKAMTKEDINIVAMTAYTTEEDRQKCSTSGMNDFLAKPIDLSKLASLLGIEYDFLSDINGSNKETVNYIEMYALELQDKIGFDLETCRELIETFKEQIRENLVRLDDAIESKDYISVKNILHQIKGASATVRIDSIHLKAKNAEMMMNAEMFLKAFKLIDRIKQEGLLNDDEK